MSASSRSRKQYGTVSLGAILPEASREMGLTRKVQEWSVCQVWARVAEHLSHQLALRTTARLIENRGGRNVLKVQVDSAMAASRLQYELPRLKAALNAYVGETGLNVDDIDLQVKK